MLHSPTAALRRQTVQVKLSLVRAQALEQLDTYRYGVVVATSQSVDGRVATWLQLGRCQLVPR